MNLVSGKTHLVGVGQQRQWQTPDFKIEKPGLVQTKSGFFYASSVEQLSSTVPALRPHRNAAYRIRILQDVILFDVTRHKQKATKGTTGCQYTHENYWGRKIRVRKMNFKSIFLHRIFLPDFQFSRSNTFFNSIVQFAKVRPNLASSSLASVRMYKLIFGWAKSFPPVRSIAYQCER